MTSRSRGGRGVVQKHDVVREVAWIYSYDQPKMRDKGGVQKPENLRDVIYGWSLSTIFAPFASDPRGHLATSRPLQSLFFDDSVFPVLPPPAASAARYSLPFPLPPPSSGLCRRSRRISYLLRRCHWIRPQLCSSAI